MKTIEIYQDDKKIYNGPIYIADNYFTRLIGLMGKKSIGDEEGIFFKNVGSIHTFFMKFEIDVVYFNKDYEVIYIETVKPNKVGKIVLGAKHVLELNKGKGSKLSKNKIKIKKGE